MAVLLPYWRESWTVATALACYALGAAYSLPPVRLKERGAAGLLAAAVAQRTLPALVIGAVWGCLDAGSLGWALLGMLVGVRYILIHQAQDRSVDLESGVQTFATQHPGHITTLLRAAFAGEIVTIAAVCALLAASDPATLILPAAYLVHTAFYYRLYLKVVGRPTLTSFAHVPLADLYGLFLPIGLLFMLAVRDVHWLVVVPLEIAWGWRGAQQVLAPYHHLVHPPAGPAPDRALDKERL
jgi:hypothetical protein